MKTINQISIDDAKLALEKRFIACNEGSELITAPNINALNLGPLTFLTPQTIDILTAPMVFDELVGANAVVKEGYFGQDTITIKFREFSGVPKPYVVGNTVSPGYDFGDVNYTGYQSGIYYYELGWTADYKEISGAGLMNFDLIADKNKAVLNSLAIERNRVNFVGVPETVTGTLPVYGLLNFPELSDYVDVPAGASGSKKWADKTSDEIFNDINFMITTLANNSKGLSYQAFSKGETYRIGVSMNVYGYLSKINQYGLMAKETIARAYNDRVKIVPVPEMNNYATSNSKNNANEDMAIIMINFGDGVETAKAQYIELARFFDIHRNGHVLSQVIVSAIAGTTVQRPIFVARFKGI